MAKFRLITNPPLPYIDQSFVITDAYFTVDTAERPLIDTWYEKNAENIIYAMEGDELHGLFNVIPLTQECGKRFGNNDIKEEEITADDILPPEAMAYAQSIYVAAIAVKNRRSFKGKQCVAALVSGMCNRIQKLYKPDYLKNIYVNPTTFEGNRFIRKLGLQPIRPVQRSLRAGNDIYAMALTPAVFQILYDTEQHYKRFVSDDSWGCFSAPE